MRFIFDTDEAFSYETLRTVGYIPYGGADIGEVLSAAARIVPGDRESWYGEWRALADRIAAVAERSAAGGHCVSASEAYLRASNYYRTAEFFLRDDPSRDPRVRETFQRSVETFCAAPQIQAQWQRVSIPYEGTSLAGYYLNSTGEQPGPTLLAHGGYDSTAEELFFVVGEAARRRGWNCLIFEGPGQGAALRLNKLLFRHDWEAVVTPAVDFALGLRGVDPERIALIGMSLGGYLAARAAAFEPRVSACVAFDGVFRCGGAFTQAAAAGGHLGQLGPEQRVAAADQLIANRSHAPTSLWWLLSNALWTFGVQTAQGLIDVVGKYDLADVVERISCPVLVCEAQNDHFFPGQPQELYDALRCEKTYARFTADEGAGEHCHTGALLLFHQRMFDWLDDTFKTERAARF
ncbi:dienelactone hydrolase [Segniliparus rotundus DSM 44985]|uniref:Dienelactone hydrolase n=1 Tax=Segniliparus rotundus (strain ATCC BAA-972 / CDC 1076 / CIP 108378 / DSM 44985 / JCM 13578) TaxID=640132 RepID=D6ZEH0_SEGRD|nr:alpha/beta hydrolase [Segniliparus rotundus]ADG99446.1 dienelactone hydrolase [Segniliparus rotundus DSM 44985]